MTDWKNRIIETADMAVKDLKANPKNWRKHPKAQADALAGVLDTVGWVAQVIWNRRTGHLIDGHLRLELAVKRKEKTIPVNVVDLSEEEEAMILATFDPIAAMAETEKQQLAALMQSIETEDEAIRQLLKDLAPPVVLEEFEPAPVGEPTAITIPTGEVIELGRHRLICGDSTDPEIVAAVLGGAPVDLLYYDPPYEAAALWRIDVPANKTLVFSDARHVRDAMYQALKFEYVYEFVWDTVISWYLDNRPLCRHRSAYLCQNVPDYDAGAGVRNDGKSRKASRRTSNLGEYTYEPLGDGQVRLTTVFQKSKADLSAEHGKPVEWIGPIIAGCGARNVLDLFGGSGSTLAACEQLGIPCFIVEKDPAKCQRIADRVRGA